MAHNEAKKITISFAIPLRHTQQCFYDFISLINNEQNITNHKMQSRIEENPRMGHFNGQTVIRLKFSNFFLTNDENWILNSYEFNLRRN
jgi:hypothetical protein